MIDIEQPAEHQPGQLREPPETQLDASSSARLVEWLHGRHGHRWSADHISAIVRTVWGSYDHAPVRNFIEVLVRNETDEILARGER